MHVERFKLEFPTKDREADAMKFLSEFIEANTVIHGSGGFDLYMDDKLFAIFKYTLTDVKDMNDKRIYLRGNVDPQGMFRNNELLLTYNIAKGTFKRPSGNTVYKFILNTNPSNPNGAHNASVMERLLKYKEEYMKP